MFFLGLAVLCHACYFTIFFCKKFILVMISKFLGYQGCPSKDYDKIPEQLNRLLAHATLQIRDKTVYIKEKKKLY